MNNSTNEKATLSGFTRYCQTCGVYSRNKLCFLCKKPTRAFAATPEAVPTPQVCTRRGCSADVSGVDFQTRLNVAVALMAAFALRKPKYDIDELIDLTVDCADKLIQRMKGTS